VLHDRCIVGDRHNSGLDVVASALDHISTSEDLSSLLLDLDEAVNVVLDSLLGVKRSNQSVLIEGVANVEFLVGSDHSFDESVVDGLVQQDSSEGCASLAAGAHCSEDTSLENNFEVSIRHHDGCIVATKLEDGASESSMDKSANLSADGGRTSERDKRNARILDQSIANVDTVSARDSDDGLKAVFSQHINHDLAGGNCGE